MYPDSWQIPAGQKASRRINRNKQCILFKVSWQAIAETQVCSHGIDNIQLIPAKKLVLKSKWQFNEEAKQNEACYFQEENYLVRSQY